MCLVWPKCGHVHVPVRNLTIQILNMTGCPHTHVHEMSPSLAGTLWSPVTGKSSVNWHSFTMDEFIREITNSCSKSEVLLTSCVPHKQRITIYQKFTVNGKKTLYGLQEMPKFISPSFCCEAFLAWNERIARSLTWWFFVRGQWQFKIQIHIYSGVMLVDT